MEKRIDLKKSVYDLCTDYPELVQIMDDLGFKDITNKTKLNTIGRVMTIPKGAIVKGIDMIDVVLALKNNGFVLTLCNPMNCSTPGFPILHYLPEFVQTHVH